MADILNSPYGYMTVAGKKYYNGHPVDNGQLRDVTDKHDIPQHWYGTPENKETDHE